MVPDCTVTNSATVQDSTRQYKYISDNGLSHSVPDWASRTSSLLAGARVPETPVNIRCPTGIELQARAQSGSGAAGPDGWSADEIKHLPLNFRIAFSAFYSVPHCWQRQFSFNRLVWFVFLNPARSRIMLFLWTAHAPLLCSMFGGDCGSLPYARVKDSKLGWKLHFIPLLELLLTKISSRISFPFSTTSINKDFSLRWIILRHSILSVLTCLSPFLISMVGLPTLLAFSMRFGAAKTDSFSIQYDHHTHSEPLKAHGILPQGDPLGPIICSLWVQSGVMSVSTSFMLEAGPSSMQIYLDDRTCTSSSVQDLFTLKEGWSHWSHSVGLLENLQKAEVSGVGSFRLAALHKKIRCHYDFACRSGPRGGFLVGSSSTSPHRKRSDYCC